MSLIKNTAFLKYAVVSGFSYGVLFSYIGLSPVFIIENMHFSMIGFGLMIAFNALAIIVMAITTPRIAKKIDMVRCIQIGLILIFCGGLVMVATNTWIAENIYTFVGPMFITTLGIGIIRISASAGAMHLVQSKIAGSAAAFFNLFSFVGGFLSIDFTAKWIHTTAHFGWFMAMMGLLALLIFYKKEEPHAVH